MGSQSGKAVLSGPTLCRARRLVLCRDRARRTEGEQVGGDLGAQRVEVAIVSVLSGGSGGSPHAFHRRDHLLGVVRDGHRAETVFVDPGVDPASPPSGSTALFGRLTVGGHDAPVQALAEQRRRRRRVVLRAQHRLGHSQRRIVGQILRLGVDGAGPLEADRAGPQSRPHIRRRGATGGTQPKPSEHVTLSEAGRRAYLQHREALGVDPARGSASPQRGET